MSDLFATIIFVFAIYCAWAIAAYQPRPTIEPEAEPVNYFPEVEDDPTPEPSQITITQLRPVAAYTAPKSIADLIQEEAIKADIVRPDYSEMGVRELYKIAAKQGIKGYKKFSKAKLISLLK